ncbi:MAG: YlmC/YmxH family sporulation protein [Clostridia bacterium]|nr:YlmC/YmxH family sporulation protein [Clostridia bacterium]
MRVEELKQREVINISDGKRLGFISDLEIEKDTVTAVILPYSRQFSLIGKAEEFAIPWDRIVRLGDDTLLVDFEIPPAPSQQKREHRNRKAKL